jgi:hypothetical protein
MKTNTKTSTMKAIILLISLFLTISCTNKREYHKLTNGKTGYVYEDDGLYYLYFFNQNTGLYDYSTSTVAPSYSTDVINTFSPSSDNTSNFSESSMSESTGTSEGGSNTEASESSDGMSESSGTSEGGSDSSGGDSGGGDSGGGE